MQLISRTLVGRIFVAALVMVIAVSITAVVFGKQLIDANAERTAANRRLVQIERLSAEVLSVETNSRAYLLTGDPQFKGRIEQHTRRLGEITSALQAAFTGLHVSNHDLNALQRAMRARIEAANALVAAYDSGGIEATRPLIESRAGTLATERFVDAAVHLVEIEQAELLELRAETETGARRLFILLGAGALINLVLLGTVYFSMRGDLRTQRALLDQLSRSGREMACLNEMNTALLSCGTREEANEVVRHYLALLLPETSGAMFMYRASRDRLERQTAWGELEGVFADALHTDECWGLRRGDVYQVRDGSSLRCAHMRGEIGAGALCVPMMALGETIGLLHVRTMADAFFDADALQLVEAAASQVSSAMANMNLRSALHTQSIKDPLTGLFNRRFLEETMAREELRAKREGIPLSILMVDLDRFKALNDEHGHHAGDEVLRWAAAELARSIRGEDIACRYGGEEFTLVLPGATLEHAMQRAERLRAAIALLEIPVGANVLTVTASFGVATLPDHGSDWRRVMERADAALYESKRQGRDRVTAALA